MATRLSLCDPTLAELHKQLSSKIALAEGIEEDVGSPESSPKDGQGLDKGKITEKSVACLEGQAQASESLPLESLARAETASPGNASAPPAEAVLPRNTIPGAACTAQPRGVRDWSQTSLARVDEEASVAFRIVRAAVLTQPVLVNYFESPLPLTFL